MHLHRYYFKATNKKISKRGGRGGLLLAVDLSDDKLVYLLQSECITLTQPVRRERSARVLLLLLPLNNKKLLVAYY
jgi:hypothetical protein